MARIRQNPASFADIERLLGTGEHGLHSLAEVQAAAQELGLPAVACQATRASCQRLPHPFIAHTRPTDLTTRLQKDHYVVVLSTTPEDLYILDPPFSAYRQPWETFEHSWTGNVLVFPADASQAATLQASLVANNRSYWALLSSATALAVVAVFVLRGWLVGTIATVIRTAQSAWRSVPRFVQIAALALTFGAAGTGIFLATTKGTAPRLDTSNSVVSFGLLSPGETEKSIEIRNIGGKPLELRSIRSSCKCVVVGLPAPIPPAGSATLDLKLKVAKGAGKADLLIESDDPSGPHRVSLAWYGRGAVPSLSPPSIRATVPYGASITRTVSISVPGGEGSEFTIERLESPLPVENLRVTPGEQNLTRVWSPDAPGGGLLRQQPIEFAFAPGVGHLQEKCLLSVVYAGERHELSLPIDIEFQQQFRVVPSQVSLFAESNSGLLGTSRVVRIQHPALEAGEELRVVNSPGWLQCSLQQVDAHQTDLTVVVNSAPDTPVSHAKVQLACPKCSDRTIAVEVLSVVEG